MTRAHPVIDFHVHPSTREYLEESCGPYMGEMARYFKREIHVEKLGDMVKKYRAAGVDRAVIYAWDAESATGLPATTNEHVADLVAAFPDFLVGFACVDPGKAAVRSIFCFTLSRNLVSADSSCTQSHRSFIRRTVALPRCLRLAQRWESR